MMLKLTLRCIFFIVLCFPSALSTHAQRTTKYIDFEATGIAGSQIKIISQEKFVRVLTTGGYVNTRLTDAYKRSEGLNFRSYYKEKKDEKIVDNLFDGPVYMYPGNEYFIDVFEQASNKLVMRYVLQRPKLSPKIEFYRQNNTHFYTTKTDGRDGELSLSPGEKVRLEIAQRKDFEGMEVEYSLRNLKTMRMQHGSSKHAFQNLVFAANTNYELRFNYVVQKESVGVLYIHVKPHWYQSPITYLVLLVVLVAIGILLLTLALKKKISSSQKEQEKLEQAAIRLQSLLNPHFTFNALSTIQGLMNTNRIDEANVYLQEFSSLLRQTLAKSQQVFNSLDQELEMMRMYIRLEAFRFNFSWTIEIAEVLNTSVIEIPTLLLQPLIENSIKHGLSGLGDKGQLTIICKEGQKKDTFVVVIKDNGTWVDKPAGYGISLTKERIRTLNTLRKEQTIVLDYNKQSGTEAILTFHHWINT